ncbi:reverse transcriptase domain-containing protein [Tanacetum coccineum]
MLAKLAGRKARIDSKGNPHYGQCELPSTASDGGDSGEAKHEQARRPKDKGSTKGKKKVINKVRSQGYRNRPYERVKHWMDNAITFPSMPRYQLVNCPVVVEAMIKGFMVKRIHVDVGSSSEVMYEHCFRNLSYRTRSRLRESRIPLVGFSGEFSYPMGVIDLEVTIGECGRTRTVIMEFAVVKSPTSYYALLDSKRVQANQGSSRPKLAYTCNRSHSDADPKVVNLRVSLAPVETHSQRPGKEPMQLDDMEGRRQPDKGRKPHKSGTEEKIVMTKKDEEKTAFHMEEGVFYYTKMPFGLKNAGATYQRLVDSAFKEQIGVNLEAYVDDMVIKSRTEQHIIKDIEQTFSTLRRINMKLNQKKCLFGMEEGKFLGYIVTSDGIRANPEKAKVFMDMPSPKTLKQMQSLSGKLAALNRFLSKSAERSLPFLDTLKKCTNKKDFRWTEAAEAAFLEMNKLVSELPTLTTPKKGETLMMYLAAANEVVSVVLLTKRDGRQMPIHYVSRSLQGAETDYAPIEKLALALVHAARRLRRVGKVLTDFLADTPTEINATPEVANNPRVEDIPESSNARKDLTPGPRAWRLYTDGASNNEGSRAGLILIAPDDVEYSYALCLNFSNSNNDAEYQALLAGLRIAKEMQVKDIHAFVDSKLVASQVEGSYKAKGERMIKYREKVLELAGAFNRFRITHIPIVENRKTDALSKLAAVQFDHLSKEVLKGKLPEDPVDARTLMEKIKNYTMEDGVLYRKAYLVPLIRNARELIRACDNCQAHASVPRLPKADMISVTSTWPFMKWGMNIVGPLPEGPGKVKYLIVAIDYFIKWIEAKPLATITGKQVVNFTYDNIVCRFGIPATIITDNGTQFVNDSFKKWAEKLKIQLIYTLVYHPQRNGVVERANKSLLRGIKTRLEKGGSTWNEEVPNVWWAHRTMKKTSNGETPFSLTYGTEAVIPAEIDLLDEQKEIAAIREARYKQQVKKYYNKKVQHVQFKVGEFVLRRNEVSRAANIGKLGLT